MVRTGVRGGLMHRNVHETSSIRREIECEWIELSLLEIQAMDFQ